MSGLISDTVYQELKAKDFDAMTIVLTALTLLKLANLKHEIEGF